MLDSSISARLRERHTGRAFILTGAGMSAESGIPTYRGEGGLWRRVDFEKLATREAFEADPLGVGPGTSAAGMRSERPARTPHTSQ